MGDYSKAYQHGDDLTVKLTSMDHQH